MKLKPIKVFIKNFKDALIREFAPDIIRGFLLEALEQVKPEHVKEAIEKWETNIWKFTPNTIKSKGLIFARKLSKYKDLVTFELLLQWLYIDRPDLYNVIVNTKNGIKWLRECFENVMKEIWK